MLLFLFFIDLTDNCLFKLITAAMYSAIYACVCVCVCVCVLMDKRTECGDDARDEGGIWVMALEVPALPVKWCTVI